MTGSKKDQMQHRAGDFGRRADSSQWFDRAIRVGLVAYGVVHLLVAWLGVQLALGSRTENVSTTGALRQLAQQPFGTVLLYVVAFGLFALVLWRLLEAGLGHQDEDGGKRVAKRAGSAAKAVIYGALGLSALQMAMGSGSGGGGGTQGMTAQVMKWPGGQVLVAAAGLAVVGYGGYLVWRGLSDKHAEQLRSEGRSGESGRAYLLLGKVGYLAKGAALAVIGVLIGWAALTMDPEKSGGLDQALGSLLQQPFGPALVAAVSVGLGCYGLFCFARARHLSR